ncbi:MAG TPA: DUF1987 domain-containing protein [Stellaceae bacterium]|jgi:hypothetical protein|nr:DUF1987 domain-containing protein [Stellaceae bacterium]
MAMTAIHIAATDRSPEVAFDFEAGQFAIKGESYPEDTARFFGPLLQSLREFVDSENPRRITFDITLQYFNSSSAKALMNLFQLLENAAKDGHDATVNWHYGEDDDAMQEFGEDFAQDFDGCAFNLCPDVVEA